jgi:hypothetical protein
MVVVPAAMPVTTPVADIEPLAGVLLLHVPPAGVLVSVVVAPTHTLNVPAIGPTVAAASGKVVWVVSQISLGLGLPGLTRFITPKNLTFPVPAAGAIHGTATAYIDPVPPVPTVGDNGNKCSTRLIDAADAECVPVGSDVHVPAVKLVLPAFMLANW